MVLKEQSPILYGDGSKRRDFIYIDDVNRFHQILITDTRSNGTTYNIGSGINYSVMDIYNAIESVLNTGLKPILKPDLPGESFQNLADISKAKKLGWKPEISLEKGLQLSIDYLNKKVIG